MFLSPGEGHRGRHTGSARCPPVLVLSVGAEKGPQTHMSTELGKQRSQKVKATLGGTLAPEQGMA